MSETPMSLTYASYLAIDELLDLQRPRSDPEEHDETLFIIIHQVYELWFKLILHEIDKLNLDLSAGRTFRAIDTLKRIRMVLKILVAQLDVLETMSPMSFRSFRDRLEAASGFQSVQFRALEFALGHKRASMIRHHAENPAAVEELERRLNARSTVDHWYDYLETQGETVPAAVRDKEVTAPTLGHEGVQDAVLRLYRTKPDVQVLLEMLTDVDEGLQEWRYRHVKMVERTIGDQPGTGGSPGVAFLRKTLFQPVFPDLWAIRDRI